MPKEHHTLVSSFGDGGGSDHVQKTYRASWFSLYRDAWWWGCEDPQQTSARPVRWPPHREAGVRQSRHQADEDGIAEPGRKRKSPGPADWWTWQLQYWLTALDTERSTVSSWVLTSRQQNTVTPFSWLGLLLTLQLSATTVKCVKPARRLMMMATMIGWTIVKLKAKRTSSVRQQLNAMEMEGAVIMFKISIELHGFRYTEMPGDGDAKTHSRLLQDPCDGRPIEKLECVNHVTMWMGTVPRNLVEKGKAQGQPTGGRENYNTGSRLWTQNS